MNVVTIGEVYVYLRVSPGVEDALLETLIDAASEAVLATADGWVPDETAIPARLKLAALAHIANAYDNRVDGVEQPAAAARLLTPLRTLDF